MEEKYNNLLSKIIERKSEVEKFIDVLHTQTTWLISPASTKYHLNRECGLLEHSIGVAETLLQLRAALAPDISEESCVIVGLFHDVGKVGMPGKPYYLPEVKDGVPTGAYTINPDIVAMGLALRSMYLVSQYIPLSDAEAQAIAYHDGMYVPEGRSVAHKEEPLLLLLHWADMWTAKVKENSDTATLEVTMETEDLDLIFNKILNKTENLIKNKKRDDIRNERIFHHMFSNEVSSYFSSKGIDIWDHLLLVPEYKTGSEYAIHKKFIAKDYSSNAKRVRKKAGQFDFAIFAESIKPQIFIEFKGPDLYQDNDIEDVMLKLLSQNKSDFKVFAAIITSSKKGDSEHRDAIENHFIGGLKSALKKLNIENINDVNLYLYVATIPDDSPAEKIFWGNVQDEKKLIEKVYPK